MDKEILIKLAKDVYDLTLLFPKKEPLRYKIREVADDIIVEFLMGQNDHVSTMRSQMGIIDSFLEIAAAQNWTSAVRMDTVKQGYGTLARELEHAAAQEKNAAAAAQKSKPAKEVNQIIYAPPVQRPMIEAESRPALPTAATPADRQTAQIKEEAPSAVGLAFEKEKETSQTAGEQENEEGGLSSSQIIRQNRILEFLKEKGGAQVWEIQKIFPHVSKRTIRRDFRSMLKQGLIQRFGERNTTFYKLKTSVS